MTSDERCLSLFGGESQNEKVYPSKRNGISESLQGDPKANFYLGSAYYHGWGGVEVNYNLAVKYLVLSAEEGFVRAMNSLGTLYRDGKDGRFVDYDEAEYWLIKAAEGELEYFSPEELQASNYCLRMYDFGGCASCSSEIELTLAFKDAKEALSYLRVNTIPQTLEYLSEIIPAMDANVKKVIQNFDNLIKKQTLTNIELLKRQY